MLAIEINDRIINASSMLDEYTKKMCTHFSLEVKNILARNPYLTAYQRKTLESEYFTYRNEDISPDTELFWQELRNHGVDFKRKDPLRFVVEKRGSEMLIQQWLPVVPGSSSGK